MRGGGGLLPRTDSSSSGNTTLSFRRLTRFRRLLPVLLHCSLLSLSARYNVRLSKIQRDRRDLHTTLESRTRRIMTFLPETDGTAYPQDLEINNRSSRGSDMIHWSLLDTAYRLPSTQYFDLKFDLDFNLDPTSLELSRLILGCLIGWQISSRNRIFLAYVKGRLAVQMGGSGFWFEKPDRPSIGERRFGYSC
jgi:hypothetical protein